MSDQTVSPRPAWVIYPDPVSVNPAGWGWDFLRKEESSKCFTELIENNKQKYWGIGASKMAQQEKVPAAKPNGLGLIPGTHTVEVEN